MDAKTIPCERCKRSVPASSIRYMPKGRDSKIALCEDCRLKAKDEPVKEKAAVKEQAKQEPAPQTSYICVRCKYKFRYEPNPRKALRCPYCGKDDNVVPDRFSLKKMMERL